MTWTSKRPVCSFMNKHGSTHKKQRTAVCKGIDPSLLIRKQQIYTGCRNCIRGTLTWHCCKCWELMAEKLRILEKIYPVPVLIFLCNYDWKNMRQQIIDSECPSLDEYFTFETTSWNRHHKVPIWRNFCPCCYSITFPDVRCSVAGSKQTNSPYPVNFGGYRQHVLLVDNIGQHDGELSYFKKRSSVHVVVVRPIMSDETQERYRYHRFDEKDIGYVEVRYLLEEVMKIEIEQNDWILLLGLRNGKKSVILSLQLVGALDSAIDVNNINEFDQLATLITKISRCSLCEKRGDDNRSRQLTKNIVRKQIYKSTLTVHRQSGPFGSMSGKSIKEVSDQLCSGRIQNGIPRNAIASVMVPIRNDKVSGDLVTSIVPLYMSVCSSEGRVSSPVKCAIPQYGWICSWKKVMDSLYDDDSIRILSISERMQSNIRNVIQREATTSINACYLLRNLAATYECYDIDARQYEKGIDEYSKIVSTQPLNARKDYIINKLCTRGRHSVVLSEVRGHCDSYFGKKNIQECISLETKIVLNLGSRSLVQSSIFDRGNVPHGCLGFPLYGMCTLAYSLSTIECHYLPDVIHLTGNNGKGDHRGSYAKYNGSTYFYPNGGAITRMSGSTTTY